MEIFLVRLAVAVALSALFGVDRELKKKDLGLKTIVTITLASFLLTYVSLESSLLYSEAYSRPMDPGRLPSYIVSGIGFLGAGVILHKSNNVIVGLTTAAFVWASAGIGIAVGLGFIKEATIVVVAILVCVKGLPYILKVLGPKALRQRKVKIKVEVDAHSDMTCIFKSMKASSLEIRNPKMKDVSGGVTRKMEFTALVDEKRYISDVYESLKKIDGILSAEVEGL